MNKERYEQEIKSIIEDPSFMNVYASINVLEKKLLDILYDIILVVRTSMPFIIRRLIAEEISESNSKQREEFLTKWEIPEEDAIKISKAISIANYAVCVSERPDEDKQKLLEKLVKDMKQFINQNYRLKSETKVVYIKGASHD